MNIQDIKNKLQVCNKNYFYSVRDIASLVMNTVIIPFCREHNVTFHVAGTDDGSSGIYFWRKDKEFLYWEPIYDKRSNHPKGYKEIYNILQIRVDNRTGLRLFDYMDSYLGEISHIHQKIIRKK